MRRNRRGFVALLVATAVLGALIGAFSGSIGGGPSAQGQTSTGGPPPTGGNDDLATLSAKLKAFQTLGGDTRDLANARRNLEDAIKAEAARIESGGDDLERFNQKLALYDAMGGNPKKLGLSDQIRRAIEAEMLHLKRRETSP